MNNPANGSYHEIGESITFEWSAPPEGPIERYELRIVLGTDLNDTPIYYQPEYSTSKIFDTSSWDTGEYIWGVRAIKTAPSGYVQLDYELEIGWSPYATRSFTINSPLPPAPTLIIPEDMDVQTNQIPYFFDWDDVTGYSVDQYRIYVDNNDGFGSPEINQTTTSSELSWSSPIDNNVYYWKVQAHNSSGWGIWSSSERQFVFDTPPSAPTLNNPANGSGHEIGESIIFSWEPPGGITLDRYYFRIAEGSSFWNTPVIDPIELESASQEVDFTSPPFELGDYSWGVRVMKSTPTGYDDVTYEATIGWSDPAVRALNITVTHPDIGISQNLTVIPTRINPSVIYSLPDYSEYNYIPPFESEKNFSCSFEISNNGSEQLFIEDWGVLVIGGIDTNFRILGDSSFNLSPGESSTIFNKRGWITDNQLINGNITEYTANVNIKVDGIWYYISDSGSNINFNVQPRPALTHSFLIKRSRNENSIDPEEAKIFYYQNNRKWECNEEGLNGLRPDWDQEFYVYPNSEISSLIIPATPNSDSTIPIITGRNLLYRSLLNTTESPFPETVIQDENSTSPYATTENLFSPENPYGAGQQLNGECTWYVYGRVIELVDNGYIAESVETAMYNAFDQSGGRDAENWNDLLEPLSNWHPTTNNPLPFEERKAGKIVLWEYLSELGHVAFVEEVNDDRSIYRVSEFNIQYHQFQDHVWLPFDGDDTRGSGEYPIFYDLELTSDPNLVYIIEPEPGTSTPLVSRWFVNEQAFYSYGYSNEVLVYETVPLNDSQLNWIQTQYPEGSQITTLSLAANFNANPMVGIAPLTVNFSDDSQGNILSWQWDFNYDGVIDSEQQNPQWIYHEDGLYDVSLTISDGSSTDLEVKTNYISVVGSFSLEGVITDILTSDPIQGAMIVLSYGDRGIMTDFSNSSGYYSFENVPVGTCNISITAYNYQDYSEYLEFNEPDNYIQNFALLSNISNQIQLTEELIISADNITIIGGNQNHLLLQNNVNINNILYFDGDIIVDKRYHLIDPEISGNCAIWANDIQGENIQLIESGEQFIYKAENNELTADLNSAVDYSLSLFGFSRESGKFVIDDFGNYIESIWYLVDLPQPLDRFVTYLTKIQLADGSYIYIPFFLEKFGGSDIYSKNDGISTAFDIQFETLVDFGVFSFKDFHLYWNESDQILGGGIKLRIPGNGKFGIPSRSSENNHNNFEISDIKLFENLSKDLKEDTEDRTIFSFLEIGFDLEFIQGNLNRLYTEVAGMNIPIFGTGAFLRSIEGGIDDLTEDDWEARLQVDIGLHHNLDIEGIGPIILLNDVGITIKPFNYFEGGGAIEFFSYEISSATISYESELELFSLGFRLNLGYIINGEMDVTIKGEHIGGGGIVNVNIPIGISVFWPLPLLWVPAALELAGYENNALGSGQLWIDNTRLDIETDLYIEILGYEVNILSLSHRIIYANNEHNFEWYIGKNFHHLYPIWRGFRNERQIVEIIVPENTKQIIIVTSNDTNLLDFILESPSGYIFNNTNSFYGQFEEVMQTVMIIDNPDDGNWFLSTEQTGDFDVNILRINQSPTILLNEPSNLGSLSNFISLDVNDYSDTLYVKFFYDNDKSFNGSLIEEFEVINNSSIEFEWQNNDIQNGEYFIYCRTDDGSNTPIMQYAPGSILVENDLNIETPQDLAAIQEGDSVKVEWNEPVYDNTIMTTVLWKNISDYIIDELTVSDTNMVYLNDLDYGQEYEIWCCFINDNYTMSEKSNIENLIFLNNRNNNPPYFTMNPDSIWVFIVDELGEYHLTANDADNDEMFFEFPQDTLSIQISNDILHWIPTDDQIGFYKLLITASDGIDTDSLYQSLVVYSQAQVGVYLSFNSLNLYENDNKFVKINNFRADSYYENVTLQNINTSEQTSMQCRKVNDFEYIGKFELSAFDRTDLSVCNGDTIKAIYNYNDNEYTTYAYYDSTFQASDIIPPGQIEDLQSSMINNTQIKLIWTASGDDNYEGTAFKYDIRYSFLPIISEDDYLVAYREYDYPYPSESGEIDSLIINMVELENIQDYNQIYFSIKVEDEMQNRSGLSNCSELNYHIAPEYLEAEIFDIYKVQLTWDIISSTNTRINERTSRAFSSFLNYKIYRKRDEYDFETIIDSIFSTDYIDNLLLQPDGIYRYAIQVIYDTGVSDSVFSNYIDMDRFEDINILCSLQDTTNYSGINFTMVGLDSIYSHSYDINTNFTGLIMLNNVFETSYHVDISKEGYDAVIDTIIISETSNQFAFNLFESLDTVQNVEISVINNTVMLSWDSVDGASSYDIYQSNNPYQGFVKVDSTSETSWTTIINSNKKYYFILASREQIDNRAKN